MYTLLQNWLVKLPMGSPRGRLTANDMVIMTRTFDMLTWLIPACEQFPKAQRFVVTQRLTDAALDFYESIIQANNHHNQVRLTHLRDASANLDILRVYLRLAYQWQWLSHGQYEHISKMVEEIGRLLGGWIKQSTL
jgi:four helix bundle protein